VLVLDRSAGAAVLVPTTDAHGDERRAGFDQPAGEQATFAPLVRAVPVADLRWFLRRIERVASGPTEDRFQGELLERIHRVHQARTVDVAIEPIERSPEIASGLEPGRLHERIELHFPLAPI